jgi:hypothetical protein
MFKKIYLDHIDTDGDKIHGCVGVLGDLGTG